MKLSFLFLFTAVATSLFAASPAIEIKSFGKTPDGKEISLFSLTNARGFRADIMNYGAIVVRLLAADREGKRADVVLGFDNLAAYLQKDPPYFGAIVGRYGNRIAHGRFTLDGKIYQLATNNAPGGVPCHLHGGKRGFDKVVWAAEPIAERDVQGLRLQYVSKDGEEGYPGTLTLTVTYWLTNADELKIEYQATADKATPVNVTNHSYFNLRGEGSGSILQHEIMIDADRITAVDKGLIPTGELKSVEGTPFDFRKQRAIGERIGADDEQLKFGAGYDHNWVLNHTEGKLAHAVTVREPQSGRVMEVWTTEPGVQFYCGNFLDGTLTGKSGKPYEHRSGFCLETQHFPDSPNQPKFPSTILRPGQTLTSTTVYRFSAK